MAILVVEDDAALRALFLALLTRNGYRVECVNDGAQALQRLGVATYGVIILDLMMPVTNGFDVLGHCAKHQPALLRRIIVTTGVSERDLAKIDRGSVFAVMRKPFDINNLLTTVRDCARQGLPPRARGPLPPGRRGSDGGDAKLDGAVRKAETTLPALDAMLSAESGGERELMLRRELRRVAGRLEGALSAAALMQENCVRAEHYQRLARSAARIAAPPSPARRRDHDH